MKSHTRRKKKRALEQLEKREVFSATVSGIEISSSAVVGNEPDWVEVENRQLVDSYGVDRVRLRFSEPVNATSDASLKMISPKGNIVGEFGETVSLAEDGLSAEWQLTRSLENEFVSISQIDDSFVDADSGVDVVDEVFRLEFLSGDITGDGEVGFDDFLSLSDNFGKVGLDLDGDFNRDGTVDFADFLNMSENFGESLDPGTTRLDAFELGTLGSSVELVNDVGFQDAFGFKDNSDVYKFTAYQDTNVSIRIGEVTGDAHFYLYTADRNDDGGVFNSSELLESFEYFQGERFFTETIAGRSSGTDYYLRVVAARSSTETPYRLAINSTPVLGLNHQDPGTFRDNASSVEFGGPEISGVITAGVDWDAYRFTLFEDSTVSINVSGLQEDTHVYLYSQDRNDDGGVFNSSELLESFEYIRGGRLITETLSGSASGTEYFVRLVPGRNATSTSYRLGITANGLDTEPDPGANRDSSTVVDLSESQPLTGVVTAGVDWDSYRFTLYEDTTVSIDIDGVSEDTHFYLYSDDRNDDGGLFNGNELLESFEYVTGDRVITESLAGREDGLDYFLRVVPARNATSSWYQVTMAGSPIADPAVEDPGSNRSSAQVVDLSSSEAISGVVTAGMDWDAYKFSINGDTTVSINIDNVQEQTHFYLYGADANNDGVFNSNELLNRLEYVTGDRVMVTDLTPTAGQDTFYLRVVPARNAISSSYQLAFSS